MFSNISLQLRIQEYTRNNILEVKSSNVHVSIISLNGGPYTFGSFMKFTFHTRTVYFPLMHQVSFQIPPEIFFWAVVLTQDRKRLAMTVYFTFRVFLTNEPRDLQALQVWIANPKCANFLKYSCSQHKIKSADFWNRPFGSI